MNEVGFYRIFRSAFTLVLLVSISACTEPEQSVSFGLDLEKRGDGISAGAPLLAPFAINPDSGKVIISVLSRVERDSGYKGKYLLRVENLLQRELESPTEDKPGIYSSNIEIDSGDYRSGDCLSTAIVSDEDPSRLLSPIAKLCITSYPTVLRRSDVSAANIIRSPDGLRAVGDELLVWFEFGTSNAIIDDVATDHDAAVVGTFLQTNLYQFGFNRKQTWSGIEEIIKRLEQNDSVGYVNFNMLAQPSAATDLPDDITSDQDGLRTVIFEQGTVVQEAARRNAWAIRKDALAAGTASTVEIAVIDVGIEGSHDDFEMPACRLATGCTDTATAEHGTKVTGVLAALSDNGLNIAGIADNTDNVRFYAYDETYTNFITILGSTIPATTDIVNFSQRFTYIAAASGNCADPETFLASGRLLIASAGNDGISTVFYPAGCTATGALADGALRNRIVSVANATDSCSGNDCAYVGLWTGANPTNFNAPGDNWVDLAAPGVNVGVLLVGNTDGTDTGTSFSAPLTAGAAAMLLSCGAGIDSIEDLLLDNSPKTDLTRPGSANHSGINAFAAMKAQEDLVGALMLNRTFNAAIPGLPDLPAATPGGTMIAGLSTNALGNCNAVYQYSVPAADPVFTVDVDQLELKPGAVLTAGSLPVTITVEDAFGRTNDLVITLNVTADIVPPVVTIDAPAIANIANSAIYPVSGTCTAGDGDVTLAIAGATPPTQAVACSAGGSWNANFDVGAIADGANAIAISASQTDAAANPGSDTATAAKDTMAPVVSISTSAIANIANSASYPVAGACTGGDGDITVSISGATPPTQAVACSAGGSWNANFDVGAIADGANAIAISASQTDAAANPGSDTATAAKDTMAPVVSISPPPNADILNAFSYPLTGSCSNGDGNVTVAIAGAVPPTQDVACAAGAWSASFDVSTVADGSNTIEISASQNDTAANSGSATATADKDSSDNCPTVDNPDQANFDGDIFGNACDPDVDTTGTAPGNAADVCPGAFDDSECNVSMCFPTFTGVPGNNNPPAIDGDVNTKPATTTELIDSGWKGAQRYTFGNGTDTPDTAFQAIKDANHLYMSFEAHSDTGFDNDDLIVLTLRPNSNVYTITDSIPTYDTIDNDDIRIFIYPLCSTGADGNGDGSCTPVAGVDESPLTSIKRNRNYRQLQVWKNSANNWAAGTITLPAGVIEAKVRSHEQVADRFWSVELKLPLAASGTGPADWPGISGNFLMYFNVVTVDTIGPTAIEYMWPGFEPKLNHAIFGNVNDYAYPNYEWGQASTDETACQGISVTSFNIDTGMRDIGTKTASSAVNPNPDNIGADGDIIYQEGDHTAAGYTNNKNNRFYANVTNNSSTSIADVRARFRIADWGYNGGWVNATWREIPGTTSNPTTPQPVPAMGNVEFTLDWIVTPVDIDRYLNPPTSSNSAHQCLLVELESGAPNAHFVKKSDYRNMNFDTAASKFEQAAALSARGYGAPPRGMARHEFLLKVDARKIVQPSREVERRLTNLNVAAVKDERRDCDSLSRMRWASRGYHNSGREVVINDNRYTLITPTGGFGYYVSHRGCADVDYWDMEFEGLNGVRLDRLDNGFYKVTLAENETIRVITRIVPVEECANFFACLIEFVGDYPYQIFIALLILLVLYLLWYIRKIS